MNSVASERDRAALHRAARRSGVRLSVHPADMRHVHAAATTRTARAELSAARRRYGLGSPQALAAADLHVSAVGAADAAALAARFERAAADWGSLARLRRFVNVYARITSHPAVAYFAALARRITATLCALASVLRALAAAPTEAAASAVTAAPTTLDDGPPPTAVMFVSTLTRAPAAPPAFALSAR
ncbi:hypothetical protein [Rhodococcus sp. MS13]|uniref:hypothetical protein n=1 Tax=Rhodococcus sp. MS13 TaxID=2579940 RepID=UPI001F5B5B2A|nr:hypothetical protein [Rhodococcus sp. MS13]